MENSFSPEKFQSRADVELFLNRYLDRVERGDPEVVEESPLPAHWIEREVAILDRKVEQLYLKYQSEPALSISERLQLGSLFKKSIKMRRLCGGLQPLAPKDPALLRSLFLIEVVETRTMRLCESVTDKAPPDLFARSINQPNREAIAYFCPRVGFRLSNQPTDFWWTYAEKRKSKLYSPNAEMLKGVCRGSSELLMLSCLKHLAGGGKITKEWIIRIVQENFEKGTPKEGVLLQRILIDSFRIEGLGEVRKFAKIKFRSTKELVALLTGEAPRIPPGSCAILALPKHAMLLTRCSDDGALLLFDPNRGVISLEAETLEKSALKFAALYGSLEKKIKHLNDEEETLTEHLALSEKGKAFYEEELKKPDANNRKAGLYKELYKEEVNICRFNIELMRIREARKEAECQVERHAQLKQKIDQCSSRIKELQKVLDAADPKERRAELDRLAVTDDEWYGRRTKKGIDILDSLNATIWRAEVEQLIAEDSARAQEEFASFLEASDPFAAWVDFMMRQELSFYLKGVEADLMRYQQELEEFHQECLANFNCPFKIQIFEAQPTL